MPPNESTEADGRTRPVTTFRELMAPVDAEVFLAEHLDRGPLHVPGGEGRWGGVFDWDTLNRLLQATTLWSHHTMKMVRDREDIPPQSYSVRGQTRAGEPALIPVWSKVARHLEAGATVVLDNLERLDPRVAAVADALELTLAAPSNCNLYCSWQAHQAFRTHYDASDVFVLQIEGRKRWHVYEGREPGATSEPGFDFLSHSRAHHDQARGELLMDLELRPGDLLYLPRGQYHDAIAVSEASLHLTFAVYRPTGLDFMHIMRDSLAELPEFRETLPAYDEPEAHRAHIRRLADRLHEVMTDPAVAAQMRDVQKERAFRNQAATFALPDRRPRQRFRVGWRGARLKRRGAAWLLETPRGRCEVSAAEHDVVAWVLERDAVERDDIARRTDGDVTALVDRLRGAGVLDPLG